MKKMSTKCCRSNEFRPNKIDEINLFGDFFREIWGSETANINAIFKIGKTIPHSGQRGMPILVIRKGAIVSTGENI